MAKEKKEEKKMKALERVYRNCSLLIKDKNNVNEEVALDSLRELIKELQLEIYLK